MDSQATTQPEAQYVGEQLAPRVTPYPDTPVSPNKIRDINIRQLNFGYIVGVGCHNFAFETVDKMVEKLTQYLKEPQKTEDLWFGGTLL